MYDVVMKAYTLGQEEGAPVYVVFEDQEGNPVPAMTGYEELWEKNGIRVVNQKEVEEKIQELLDTVGGKYDSCQAEELVFSNGGDGYAKFEMADINLKISEEEESYSIIYNEWMSIEGSKIYESDGDEALAQKILEELDYLYFVEINASNIEKYVTEDYQNSDLHGRSGEDVAKMMQYFFEDACERMNALTDYDGVVEGSEYIGYSFDRMTQGWK